MIVREFLTRLAFNADDAKVRKFDKAVRVLRTSLLAVVGAATAASGAAFKLTNDTARYGDELAKTARRLGINVDALERLRFAAERSGVAQNTLEMALQRMTRRLSEAAAGGGEAQKAIQELGLDAQALGNMNPEEAMLVLADALEGVENQSERVRLAFKFFDSEGVALLNMLDGGSEKVQGLGDEFERLGGGLTGKQAAAAEAFTDAMTNMQSAFGDLRLQIGAKLMPIFKPLIEQFTEFLVINRELILERIHRTFEILIGVMRSLMRIAGRVWSVVDGLAQAFGGWENTLRLVAGAASALVAIKVVKWLNAIKSALTLAAVGRFGGWALAIGGLVLAFDELATFMRGGEGYLTDLSEWMQGLEIDEGIADTITKIVGALGALASATLMARLLGVGMAVRGVGGAIRTLSGITGLAAVKTALAGVIGAVAMISAPVWLAIAAAVAAVGVAWKYWDRISSIVSGVASAIGDRLRPAFNWLGDKLEFLDPLIGPVADAFGRLGDKVKGAFNWIKQFLGGGLFSRETLTEEERAEIEAKAEDMTGRILDWFTGLPGKMFQIGRDMITALWDGMKSIFSDMMDWVDRKTDALLAPFENITANVKGIFGIGSETSGDASNPPSPSSPTPPAPTPPAPTPPAPTSQPRNGSSHDRNLDRKLGAEGGKTLGQMLQRRLGLDNLFGGDGANTESGDSVPDSSASDGLEQITPPSSASQPRNGSSATSGSGTNETFMRRDQEISGVIDQLSRFFGGGGPQMTPAMAPATVNGGNTSNVVNMDASINVTVPPGSNAEQAQYIASRVRAEIEREVNRAGTALEA